MKYISICLSFVILAVCVLVLTGPAILNGFPLVFSDSNVYIVPAWKWPPHPPYYGAAVDLIHRVFSGPSLYFLPFAQSVAVTAALVLGFKTALPSSSLPVASGGALLVILLSQLPWLASWIMTDVWFGVGVLCIFALGMRNVRLPLVSTMALWGVVVFCSIIATSSILIYVGVVCVIFVLRLLISRAWSGSFLLGGIISVTLTVAIVVSVNTMNFGKSRLNVGGNALLFSRTVDLNLAQDYVRRKCVIFDAQFCSEVAALPPGSGQAFLWSSDTIWRYEGWTDPDDKLGHLARLIIYEHFWTFFTSGLKDMLRLFARSTLEHEDLQSRLGDELEKKLKEFYPSQLAQFRSAWQQRDALGNMFPYLYYEWLVHLSYATAAAFCAVSWRNGEQRFLVVGLSLAFAIILSNALHAFLVGAYGRYHVKASWLVMFYCVAWILGRASRVSHARQHIRSAREVECTPPESAH